MLIQVRLRKIQPHEYELLEQYPYEGCRGDAFKPNSRQVKPKRCAT